MILVNITYQIVTPESAEHGEAAESGFLAHNEKYSFRELVEALRYKFTNASCSPCIGNVYNWFSTDANTDSLHIGSEYTEAFHYSRDNPARKEKYWAKAIKASGLK